MIASFAMALTDLQIQAIKDNFSAALASGDIVEVFDNLETYAFLTKKYDVEIFEGMLNCFDNPRTDKDVCSEFFELLKPSCAYVSDVINTPLIQAIQHKNDLVTEGLLNMPEVLEFVDKTDFMGRTALMFASMDCNRPLITRILEISKATLNLADLDGFRAVDYAFINENTK